MMCLWHELTSLEVMVAGRYWRTNMASGLLMIFLIFLQAIDATPQEKSNSKTIWFSNPNGSSFTSIVYLKSNKRNLTVEIYHVWPLIAPQSNQFYEITKESSNVGQRQWLPSRWGWLDLLTMWHSSFQRCRSSALLCFDDHHHCHHKHHHQNLN